ncbi:ribosomal protein S18 acetylase RimI-like enzyme [Natronobacillus azotifigens]|uniref:GNAT family N-acetyltransferase n=1 Tax=Natronobacillus azotifigens TaxID=472978 RepID=A0A9J6REU9_9BACI|nr:GNAT family N-acetyltransferase [Natronobacillus azotifigens]MCZ0703867.1 GNAT family N-acetyltransferase [Natronobacillus azotifigens]
MEGYTIKVKQTNDYELIAKLNKPVHDLHCALYPERFNTYNFEEMQVLFKELMYNDAFIFLVIYDQEEAVGYAWIEIRNYPENPLIKGYHSIYVHQLSVVAWKRKQGYGTELLRYIEELAKERNIDVVELDYWVDNLVARHFYQKHHFTKKREFVYKKIDGYA